MDVFWHPTDRLFLYLPYKQPFFPVYHTNRFFLYPTNSLFSLFTIQTAFFLYFQVDVSWHPTDGLVLYVNGEQVGQQSVGSTLDIRYDSDKRFYIGRRNSDMIWERYANAIFDDVEVWEKKWDYNIVPREEIFYSYYLSISISRLSSKGS